MYSLHIPLKQQQLRGMVHYLKSVQAHSTSVMSGLAFLLA